MVTTLLALALLAAPSKTHRVKVAVLDVEDVAGSATNKAKLLTQVLTGELPKIGKFDAIGSGEIRRLIGFERQKQLLGCKEDSCLAELGGALGVEYVLISQLGKFGSRYRLDLRLMDAGKSRVRASEGDFVAADDDALADAAVEMEHKLFEDAQLAAPAGEADGSAAEAAGGLTQTQAAPIHASHTGAWIAAGGAVAFAAVAVFMSLQASHTFDDARACYQNELATPLSACDARASSLAWKSPVADALWVGAAALAGTSTYLFLRAPKVEGSGGEVGVGGRF